MEIWGRGWFIHQRYLEDRRVEVGLENFILYNLYRSKSLPEDKVIVRINRNVFQTIPIDYFLVESGLCFVGEIDTIPIPRRETISIRVLRLEDGVPVPTTRTIYPIFASKSGYGVWEIVDERGNRYFLLETYADNENLELPLEHIGESFRGTIPRVGKPFMFYSIVPYPELVEDTFVRLVNPIYMEYVLTVERVVDNFYKISGLCKPLLGSHKEYIEVCVSTLP